MACAHEEGKYDAVAIAPLLRLYNGIVGIMAQNNSGAAERII